MSELGMNERAWTLADRYVARAYDLRMGVRTLSSGARVIDAGVEVPGGLEAGLMLAELCMGGLGHVSYAPIVFAGEHLSYAGLWQEGAALSAHEAMKLVQAMAAERAVAA